uniref:C3H1-type domain-containing protein n=1 Tax=Araucaria cunninghamii TaxID=56994 RepID=A0A0D6QRL1_ARACU
MPIQKYYCDYCDKQFQDTPSARKRHLQGLQHQRAKKLWYDSFNDPPNFGNGKGLCAHFVRTGFCQYGENCKYFHPVQTTQQNAGVFRGDQATNYVPISLLNLPPSLRPPPEVGYPPLPFIDWG